jgi:2'-5' RNA ligase
MKRRLFVAIDVPAAIRENIAGLIDEIGNNLPADARIAAEENWHFTVIFLGEQEETAIPAIRKSMDDCAKTVFERRLSGGLNVKFERVVYGPPGGGSKRMIWLEGDRKTLQTLGGIKELLTELLERNGANWERNSFRSFNAHLTLARFLPRQAGELPVIERKIDWHYGFNEMNLMESHLNRRYGASYDKLYSVVLGREIALNE